MKFVFAFLISFAVATQGSEIECEGCKAIAAALDGVLTSQSVETDLTGWIQDLCKDLPTSLQSACTQGITQYGPQIFQELAQLLDGDSLCPAIGFCSSKVRGYYTTMRSKPGLECELCEWAVGEVKNEITSSGVLTKVLAYLGQVCSALPSEISGQCTTIVNQYGSEIVQKILNILDPTTACAEIHMCSSSKKVAAVRGDSVGCDMCKGIMAEVDQIVSSEEPSIIAWANNACQGLPSSLQADCATLINSYGKNILDMVINQLAPSSICPKIHACPSTSQVFMQKKNLNSMCDTCKAVVQQVQNMVKNEETTIVNGLDSLCSKFGGFAQMCEGFVNQYATQVVSALVAALDPATVCAGIKVC